jgi:hypothetical protein
MRPYNDWIASYALAMDDRTTNRIGTGHAQRFIFPFPFQNGLCYKPAGFTQHPVLRKSLLHSVGA